VHPEQLLQARYRQLQHFDAVSDLVRPSGGSTHVETARPSEGSGGGDSMFRLALHISSFIDSIRVRGGSGGGGPVGHVRSLIDNIRPIGGLGGGGSGYVTSTVSGTQQNVLFEQFPLLLFIPGV